MLQQIRKKRQIIELINFEKNYNSVNKFIRSFNTTEEESVNQNSMPSENICKNTSNKKTFPMTQNRENCHQQIRSKGNSKECSLDKGKL